MRRESEDNLISAHRTQSHLPNPTVQHPASDNLSDFSYAVNLHKGSSASDPLNALLILLSITLSRTLHHACQHILVPHLLLLFLLLCRRRHHCGFNFCNRSRCRFGDGAGGCHNWSDEGGWCGSLGWLSDRSRGRSDRLVPRFVPALRAAISGSVASEK